MRKAREKDITMVFQDPTTYLNPVYAVGTQIGEVSSTMIFPTLANSGRTNLVPSQPFLANQ